jgi:hypothetical protein
MEKDRTMAKQTEQREVSRGVCRFCQGEFAKNRMTQHLKSCKGRVAREGDGQGQRLFHVLVEGRYRPEYWMHLEVPAVATLGDLDSFLRTTWLECCDHLSEFEIAGVSYPSYPDDGWGMGFGGLSLVGKEGDEENEEDEEDEEDEDEELPDMQEVAREMSEQLSAEFQADLRDVPVEKIEERLAQLFAENMPPGMPAATLPALRPLLGYMAQSLQQGTLAQDLMEAGMEDEEEGGMDAELGEVLAVGEKFTYTYDFGSSSTLSLRVIAEREGTLPSDLDEAGEGEDEEFEGDEEDEVDIVVMARNEPPALVCHVCGQPASYVPSGSEYDALAEVVLCETHANATEEPDELLPLVNSPRTGVCGYTGEEEEEWEDEEDQY